MYSGGLLLLKSVFEDTLLNLENEDFFGVPNFCEAEELEGERKSEAGPQMALLSTLECWSLVMKLYLQTVECCFFFKIFGIFIPL